MCEETHCVCVLFLVLAGGTIETHGQLMAAPEGFGSNGMTSTYFRLYLDSELRLSITICAYD